MRNELDDLGIAVTAGGMPDRVKCLHVLVAHSLAVGRGVNPLGDRAVDALPRLLPRAAGVCASRGHQQLTRAETVRSSVFGPNRSIDRTGVAIAVTSVRPRASAAQHPRWTGSAELCLSPVVLNFPELVGADLMSSPSWPSAPQAPAADVLSEVLAAARAGVDPERASADSLDVHAEPGSGVPVLTGELATWDDVVRAGHAAAAAWVTLRNDNPSDVVVDISPEQSEPASVGAARVPAAHPGDP